MKDWQNSACRVLSWTVVELRDHGDVMVYVCRRGDCAVEVERRRESMSWTLLDGVNAITFRVQSGESWCFDYSKLEILPPQTEADLVYWFLAGHLE